MVAIIHTHNIDADANSIQQDGLGGGGGWVGQLCR